VNANLNVGGSLVIPTSHTLISGIVAGGSLGSISDSDDSYFSFRPGIVFHSGQSPVFLTLNGNSVNATPNSLAFVIESGGSSGSLVQRIEMYDFVNQVWVEADVDMLSTSDVTYTASAPGPPTNFITPASGSVAVRIGVKPNGPILTFPWRYRIDQAGWAIN
jgi:hypothetical protein